ncbi:hypothetical protein Pint_35166 [Pistacia integerrima]|uniref:Uncharacterized protein n=1 Tax=Pistacia integerrima TaxID=434235 RepID=A0ACC0Y128_9ROSI|nr:hypothetical protein Pint_35166 [Pistacia integerrima]
MASTEGLVPITRSYLCSYYNKYPFAPLSDEVALLSSQIRSLADDLLQDSPPSQDESLLIQEADRQPPHKIDENMWKNREHMEEILFLLERSHWPAVDLANGHIPNRPLQQPSTPDDAESANVLEQLSQKFQKTLNVLKDFQSVNSDRIFNTVMTYMPQDFRGTLIRQQRERSERNKQAEVDTLINLGGSIRDRYALLWKQQMDRRRQLAQLGSATGVYKTLVKYLVGVPQVLLDFVRQINDDDGMIYYLHIVGNDTFFVVFLLQHFWLMHKLSRKRHQFAVLEQAVDVYTSEFERFIKFIGEVFANSPFFISAEVAGGLETGKNDEYKETTVPAGKNYEVSFMVDSVNSYIAWDFSLVQGKINMDIGFSLEYTNPSGEKTLRFFHPDCCFETFCSFLFIFLIPVLSLLMLIASFLFHWVWIVIPQLILPYRRYESDQGNFCTVMVGNYKLIWDNSYSTFFKKVSRCVQGIP